MKAQGPVDFAPIWCFRAEKHTADRGIWDLTADKTYVVQKEGVNGYITYCQSRRVVLLEPRAFVLESINNKFEDGSYVVVHNSNPDRNDIVEVPSGVTRAALHASGWYFEQDPMIKDRTNVTLICEIDFKLSIPDIVMDIAFRI